MKKQKKPGAANNSPQADMQDDAVAQRLLELAIDLRELDVYASVPDELKKKQSELRRLINKCLQQGKDAALDEALERSAEEDARAYDVFRAALEELSETIIVRRSAESAPARGLEGDLEVNAFVIPVFVRTLGGLDPAQCFQDEEAFDLLRGSLQEGGLESRQASVVLVSHAYHLDELERISYSQLHAMVHEASQSMTRKKPSEAPAIARSMSGWPERHFGAEDHAVELRFLLGFALKSLDDPFYQIPEKEAAADKYFEARAQRFQRWTQDAAPLLARCLVTDGRTTEFDFLYQDLFHGGKASAVAEYRMLQMMADLQESLDQHGLAPEATRAIVGPIEADDEILVRVDLHAESDDRLLGSAEKPLGHGRPLQTDIDDVCDALNTLGVKTLMLAARFDAEGKPLEVRPVTSQ